MDTETEEDTNFTNLNDRCGHNLRKFVKFVSPYSCSSVFIRG